jgi:tetratricopeptide (TPR) repeat protein
MAYATRGEHDLARTELQAMTAETAAIGKEGPTGWGNNTAANMLSIASEILLARRTWALSQDEQAIEHLKLAVTHEDALVYDEPPQWMAPAREALGGAYLRSGRPKLAKETFEEALRRHPNSGRALYGLFRAQQDLKEEEAAKKTKALYEAAWKGADAPMTDVDLW